MWISQSWLATHTRPTLKSCIHFLAFTKNDCTESDSFWQKAERLPEHLLLKSSFLSKARTPQRGTSPPCTPLWEDLQTGLMTVPSHAAGHGLSNFSDKHLGENVTKWKGKLWHTFLLHMPPLHFRHYWLKDRVFSNAKFPTCFLKNTEQTEM